MENDIVKKNAAAYDAQAATWEENLLFNTGHIYLEKPAIFKELPSDLSGRTVLVIGVGGGLELEEILARNPARVVAIDTSGELLRIAKERAPHVEFQVMDMMQLSFPDAAFDAVFSSLTFHYSPDWDVLLAGVSRVMKPGGVLVFSTHNPDYWGKKPATGNVVKNERGVTLTEHAKVLNSAVSITYYNHISQNAIRDALLHAGFTIESFVTPVLQPLREDAGERERSDYEDTRRKNEACPYFVVVRATKP